MQKADGFDEAIIGVGSRCGQPDILVYDAEKCIELLCTEMSREEAEEYFDYNVAGAWVGDDTPIFLSPYEPELEQPDDPWPDLIP